MLLSNVSAYEPTADSTASQRGSECFDLDISKTAKDGGKWGGGEEGKGSETSDKIAALTVKTAPGHHHQGLVFHVYLPN